MRNMEGKSRKNGKIVKEGLRALWRAIAILAFYETAGIFWMLMTGVVLGDFTDSVLQYDIRHSMVRVIQLTGCILISTWILPMVGLLGNYFLFTDALRHDRFIFHRYFDLPYERQKEISLGEIQYRIENDANQFRIILVFTCKYLICLFFSVIGLLYFFYERSWAMLWPVLIFAVVKWGIMEWIGKISAGYYRAEREMNSELRKYEMDICSYLKIFQIFRWEDGACRKVGAVIGDGIKNRLKPLWQKKAGAESLETVINAVFSLAILLAGCLEMGKNQFGLSDLLVILAILPVIEKLTGMADYCIKNRKQMKDLLERLKFFYEDQKEADAGEKNKNEIRKISGKDITFAYQQEKVLENFSFSIRKGKTAICGKNGRGKSTLLKIICGFLKNYEGNIYIDRMLLKGNEESWYHDFVYVPQEPHIFAGKLEENVAMSESYDENRMGKVLALTGLGRLAGRDISNETVSGGERQRIALARALYSEREWIFMDEPTNNLDRNTVMWLKDFISSTDQAFVYVTHEKEMLETAGDVLYI